MVSNETLLGLHHVTALAGDPRRNLDFYARIPGMRLVKRTVNFDDPAGYHLYFGAGNGAQGTLLTFFPWAGSQMPHGVPGSGQITGVTLLVPARSLEQSSPAPLVDPDGIAIEFVESAEPPRLQSVTLCEADAGPTIRFLGDTLGLNVTEEGPEGSRLELPDAASPEPAWINVLHSPGTPRGTMAAGAIHHVALRVADEAAQLRWREKLIRAGVRVSPVKDRLYFHSIYFREPGGVLLEIATDGPGFLIDEAGEGLGQRLCLPPWLEPARDGIERRLPALWGESAGAEKADG